MENKEKHTEHRSAMSLFLRSMLVTFAAVALIIIGYICAGFLFGTF